MANRTAVAAAATVSILFFFFNCEKESVSVFDSQVQRKWRERAVKRCQIIVCGWVHLGSVVLSGRWHCGKWRNDGEPFCWCNCVWSGVAPRNTEVLLVVPRCQQYVDTRCCDILLRVLLSVVWLFSY